MPDNTKPVMALSRTFMEALWRLPRSIIKKTMEFVERFPEHAKDAAVNYEPIKGAAGADFRSARITGSYRAIIQHPAEGNEYLLLWVDTHEEAYRWACSHVCRINHHTKSLQIYATDSGAEAAKVSAQMAAVLGAAEQMPALFARCTDETLLKMGVPDELMARVRALRTVSDLEACSQSLPQDAYEKLIWVADGEDPEEVLLAYRQDQNENQEQNPQAAAGNEWRQALQNAEAAGVVRVIENDEDMRRIVEADLAAWRVFLHPLQRRIVDAPSLKPTLVRGSAGTGKTVVALHRAVKLVTSPDWDPEKKLLLTTFTTNLATDLEQDIRMICPLDQQRRIEVTNIDAWVTAYLRRMRIVLKIIYPGQEQYQECWDEAVLSVSTDGMPFDENFYREEFERVILPQQIETEQQYLRASRRGRGRILSRQNRKSLWPLFERFRAVIKEKNFITIEDACYLALRLISENPFSVKYAAVVVDETQDMSAAALKLLDRLAASSADETSEPCIFLVGDGHQRIYARSASLSQCGINVRGKRSRKLRITYRTTDEIRKAANAVLENRRIDDMDEGDENFRGDTAFRHGSHPAVMVAQSVSAEEEWILEKIRLLTAKAEDAPIYELRDICIVARTREDARKYADFLNHEGLATVEVQPRRSDDPAVEGVRYATMHRVKGLEFKIIFIVNASEGVMPRRYSDTEDDLERARLETTERALFYVAATRARDALFVSCAGRPGEFIRNFAGV